MIPTHIIVEASPTLDRAEQKRVRDLADRLDRERRECSELEQQIERARRKGRKFALRGKFGSAGSGFVEDFGFPVSQEAAPLDRRGDFRQSKSNKHTATAGASSSSNKNRRANRRTKAQVPRQYRSTRHNNRVAVVDKEVPRVVQEETRRRGPSPPHSSGKVNESSGVSRGGNRKHRFPSSAVRDRRDRRSVPAGGREPQTHRKKASRQSHRRASAPVTTTRPRRSSVHGAAASSATQATAVDPSDRQKDEGVGAAAAAAAAVPRNRAGDTVNNVPEKPLTFEGQSLDRQFWEMLFAQIDANRDGVICARDFAAFLECASAAVVTDGGGGAPSVHGGGSEVEKPGAAAARRAAILRTIFAKTLRSRLLKQQQQQRGGGGSNGRSNSLSLVGSAGSIFPSLDSFGRGTVSKEDFLDVLYRGKDLCLQHRQKAALALQQVDSFAEEEDDDEDDNNDAGDDNTGIPSSAQPARTPSTNRATSTSVRAGNRSGVAPSNATTTAVDSTTPDSTRRRRGRKKSVRDEDENEDGSDRRGALLKDSGDDGPKSIQRRARLGDQMAFRRSVLAAVFLAITGGDHASNTASVANAVITGRDLQDFLASSDRDHKYLRQQFRLLTRGPTGQAILDACLSSSAIDQTHSRSQFIRRFARGTTDNPRGWAGGSNESATPGGHHAVDTDDVRTPSPRRAHFGGQRSRAAMQQQLREIFGHYARQRAWQETAQMESSAWNHLLLDADRSHSSSAVLFDNQHLAPADADIVYSEAASRETARLRQDASENDSASLLLAAAGTATPSGVTRTPRRRTDLKRRFTFEAFLVALKLLFVRRFGHTVAVGPGSSTGKGGGGGGGGGRRGTGSDGEGYGASSSRSDRETVVAGGVPVFASLPQLLRHCLLTYILPLHEPLAAAARHRAQGPPPTEPGSATTIGKQQQRTGRRGGGGGGGAADADPPVIVEDHLRYRPALHTLVQRFRSVYFAGDADARAFLRQNEAPLRSLFLCFSRSPSDSINSFTAPTNRTPSTRTAGGRSGSSSSSSTLQQPTSLVASRVSAWKSLQREACRLSWAECRVFANTFGILRFVDVVELKALFEECRVNSCVAAAMSDPASTFVEEFGAAHQRRQHEESTEYVGYPARNPTGHALAQHTTGAYVSPESQKKLGRGRQWSPSSSSATWGQTTLLQDDPGGMQSSGLEAEDDSFEGRVPSVAFPAFLDLVGMLALLVTERSGDCVFGGGGGGGRSGGDGGGDAGVRYQHGLGGQPRSSSSTSTSTSTSTSSAPPSQSATQVLELFFFRIYSSGGAREIVMGDLGIRAFFAAVDRSVRLLMQRRVRAQRLEQAALHEANLQMMFDCMAE